jgi:D-alanyl-D-alanine carboxypeptidase
MAKTSAARVRGTPLQAISITRATIWALFAVVFAAAAPRATQAQVAASILVDEASGRVLQAYRADSPHAPASLTKMMTLYLTFEALEQGRVSLSTPVQVSFRAAAMSPSKLGLRPGQEATVDLLINATAIKSANDAAAALGEFLANGSESAFAQRMTAKARELGMNTTVFTNASGLPGGAYTTARDMATLARALHTRFPKYSHVFSKRYFQYGARTYRNTNRLLHTRGEVDGMKTGYTRAAGFNLVATAEYRSQKVILVVLGGRTSGLRYRHAEQLLGVAYRGLPAAPPANANVAAVAKKEDFAKHDDDDHDEEETKPAAKKPGGFSLVSRAHANTRLRAPDRNSLGAMRYGVQIGAYGSRSLAQNAAQRAYYSVPASLRNGSTRIAVVPVKYGRKTQYAARVLGFNHSAASSTCRHLARHGTRCQTVQYSLQSASLHGTPDVPNRADDDDDDDRPVVKTKYKAKKYIAKKRSARKSAKRYASR